MFGNKCKAVLKKISHVLYGPQLDLVLLVIDQIYPVLTIEKQGTVRGCLMLLYQQGKAAFV